LHLAGRRTLVGEPASNGRTATEENRMQRYHITHEDDRWVLKEEGDRRVLVEATTKEEIISETRDYMKLRTGSVKIHTQDGRIEEERTYPRDQDPRETCG